VRRGSSRPDFAQFAKPEKCCIVVTLVQPMGRRECGFPKKEKYRFALGAERKGKFLCIPIKLMSLLNLSSASLSGMPAHNLLSLTVF